MKTASEVSVDSQGYARDDEGNSWFVGKQYAGWFGNYSQARRKLPPPPRDQGQQSRPRRPMKPRLPKMTPQEHKEFRETADKLVIALVGKGDLKSLRFVKDIQYKSELTEKQKSYFDSLVKRNQRAITQLPKVGITYWGGAIGLSPRISDNDRKKIEKVVDLLDSGRYLSVRPLSKKPKPQTTPGGGDQDKKLQVLDVLIGRMPNNGFLKSLRKQVAQGKTLTEKQLKPIRQMLYKNRMRSEADMFRAAAKRVAAAWLEKQDSSRISG
jgi:hypothetical protein